MFFERTLKALNKAKVKYIVAGGVAVYLHGIRRNTVDLDIIIDMSEKNIERLFFAMKKIGFTPKVPVTAEQFKIAKNRKKWIKEKNMKVFSFVNLDNPVELVDIFVIEPITYKKARKVVRSDGRMKVPTLGIKDLIKLKKIAGRDQDLIDISDLERLEASR